MTDLPFEASPEDVAEHLAGAGPAGVVSGRAVDLPLEADPADALDQRAEVLLDDDEY